MAISNNSLSEIRLVIFDLDGTLVDSQLDLALSVNAMRRELGLRPRPQDVIATYVGRGVNVLVRKALGDQATESDVEKGLAIFLEYYRRHMLDHTETYAGVREGLEQLRGRMLAVLTNKPVDFSREMLRRLEIAHSFSFIYGGNSFVRKKPDPVGVTKLMEDTGIVRRQTLIVGDSDTDVLTGRAAGIWTCGVTYGFGARTLENALPDLLISDLRDLPLLLDGHRKAVGSRQFQLKKQSKRQK